MPVKIEVGIPEAELDGRIGVMHIFYGRTEAEARRRMEAHGDVCPRFGPALKADDVTMEIIEIDDDEWPSEEDPTAGEDLDSDEDES